jgi:hypothetical protein
MSVKEKIRRLGQMGLPEVKFRAAQKWRITREQLGLAGNGVHSAWCVAWDPKKVPSPKLRELLGARQAQEAGALLNGYFARRKSPQFFFEVAERDAMVAAHHAAFPGRVASLRAEADALCEHRFRIFAYPEVRAGAEIPWRRDLVHGQESGLEHWASVPYLDFAKVGDSKIVWEPNRHQHFFTLAQAWFLINEEKYAEECLAQFESWQRENPFGRGINWASSLEAAFRVWSWLWTIHLLQGSRALTGMRLGEITRAIAQHARFILGNLSTYFSPNTHLLGEGFALFAVGLLLPELRGAADWREAGRRILNDEVLKQVRPDGAHIEQSSYYHRYALDFFQCAAILAERNGRPFPAAYRAQLERMAEFTLHSMLPGGRHPMTGDADGGRLLPFSSAPAPQDSHDQRGALSTAAVYFQRGDFRYAAGRLHEETLWLLGARATEQFAALAPRRPAPESRLFPEAGLVVMRHGGDERALVLHFDAGAQGLGGCAHGHADALSIVCSADGVDWLVDPGTYVYTSSREWRAAFSGTAAHTTAAVDGADQGHPVDFFKWAAIPRVKMERWASLPGVDLAVASHNGYARLPQPVTHRRRVAFVKPDYWLVTDELTGPGEHEASFPFHFAPGVKLAPSHGGWLASSNGSRFLLMPCASGLEFFVVQGDEATRQGWFSAEYGHRLPAPVLVARTRGRLPMRFHWLLWAAPAAWPKLRELPGAAVRLEIETEAWTDAVAFREEGPLDDTGLATDAELAVTRRDAHGRLERLMLVSGCCADWQGQPLLRADSWMDEVDAARDGDTLEVHLRPARRLRLRATDVTRVRVNGAEAACTRTGEWIEL